MHRTIIGLGAGIIAGALSGLAGGQFFFRPPTAAEESSFFLAALMATGGAVAGAVVGGVADMLAFLRQAFADLSLTAGPEDDYREPKPPPAP